MGNRPSLLPIALPISLGVAIVRLASMGPYASADASPGSNWIRPVGGGVVDAFDAPRSRFGAGHLGVDLAAPAGTAVRAAGSGVASFAGSVAGGLHVVVAHAGGLRTSYSFLATIAVRRGAHVAAGEVVGTTGGTWGRHDGAVLHMGLRSGDDYVDPMLLFEPVDLASVVYLAPTTEPSHPASASNERRGLLAGLVHGVGGAIHAAGTAAHAVGTGVAATARAAGSGMVAVGGGVRRFLAAHQGPVARAFSSWLSQSGHCDPDAPAADGSGGSDHRVMLIAGLNSSITNGGASTALPARRLGYESNEVSYFSYAADGGDYTAADTEGSLRTAARRLGAQLRELQRREPGREVDLIGHSQGGVIMTEFLVHLYHPGDPSYPPLGKAVALASPLRGATGATAVGDLERSAVGRRVLDGAHAVGAPNWRARALADLNQRSGFSRGVVADRPPPVIDVTSIAAAQDVIAPAGDTTRDGARNRTVMPHSLNGHSGIVTDDAALAATRAALEGKPLPCQSLTTLLTGEVVSTAIGIGERRIGDIGSLVAAATGE